MVRKLKNLCHFFQALFSLFYFRYPAKDLKVIGVTGTDGKTTTVHLINFILKRAKKRSAFISSVGAQIGDQEIETGFHVTTPSSFSLQKLLKKIKDLNFEYVVLEATSHGLDQHRLLGCHFFIGVVTNITHEHLDYHQTFKKYLAAKAKLFRGVKFAVLNRDDESFNYLSSKCKPSSRAQVEGAQSAKVITYGIKNKADFTPKTFPFKTSLPGEYNQANCLAAIAVAKALGFEDELIREAIRDFPGVPGRMEKIDEGQDFSLYVDFCHTPNALLQTLETLKKQSTESSQLIVVFGSAGLRDKDKRPMMGEIASQKADLAILTAEDPRTEDVNKIIKEIAEGCQKAGGIEGKTFFKVPDRKEAIKLAVNKAKKSDLVVICGKGHEKSMCFGKKESPWSDQEEARKALKKRNA